MLCKSNRHHGRTLLTVEDLSLLTRAKARRSQASLRLSTLSHSHMEDTVPSYWQTKPLSRNILSASSWTMAKDLSQQRRGSTSGFTIQYNTTSKSKTLVSFTKIGCQLSLAIGTWRTPPILDNPTMSPTRLLKMRILKLPLAFLLPNNTFALVCYGLSTFHALLISRWWITTSILRLRRLLFRYVAQLQLHH